MEQLSNEDTNQLLETLKHRFSQNMARHVGLNWDDVATKLSKSPEALWSLNEMERTGGEPDVVEYNMETNRFIFMDCSTESPKGRRSLCYDKKALDERKENKPVSSALEMSTLMGIELLDEQQYIMLQSKGSFDTKTSSWLKTPQDVRTQGGAIYGDNRFGRVFVYHNGAESYYAARGFRGQLAV